MSTPYNSIFGIQAPKFISGETTVNLDYAEYNWHVPVWQVLKQESIITKKRIYWNYGDHWLFEIIINLFKYAEPVLKFREIFAYRNAQVTLYPHREGEPFKDENNEATPFKLADIVPIWIFSPAFPDRLILRFESVKTSKLSPMTWLLDDKDRILTDDKDTIIVAEGKITDG